MAFYNLHAPLFKGRLRKERAFKTGKIPGFAFFTYSFFAYLYIPIIILIVFSFNETRSATVWSNFSLDWYSKAFANDDIQTAAYNSLVIAVIATIVATTVATLAALVLRKWRYIASGTATNSVLMLPLLVPEIVTAVATLSFFSAIGLSLGLGNIIVAHSVFCIPFAYFPIKSRLAVMDSRLEAVAHDLYASTWQSFRWVTLPLLCPGILSGAMLAFVISLDDFIITLLVAEAGSTTLPIYIYGMVRIGISPEVNAVSTVMLLISMLFVGCSYIASKKT